MGFLDTLRGKPDVKRLKERSDVEGLVRALSHEDWTVRSGAAEALGNSEIKGVSQLSSRPWMTTLGAFATRP